VAFVSLFCVGVDSNKGSTGYESQEFELHVVVADKLRCLGKFRGREGVSRY
jgi:hypothetical protein